MATANSRTKRTNIYKPNSNHGPAILYQNAAPVSIYSADGQLLDRFDRGINGREGTKHPINPSKYPAGSYWEAEGRQHKLPDNPRERVHYPIYGDVENNSKDDPTTNIGELSGDGPVQGQGAGTFNGSNISQTPGGSGSYVVPGLVDYSSLEAPYVDFQANVDRARREGETNRDIFFENLDLAKDPALGLIDTDILGINRGLDGLLPRYRAENQLDQDINIARAGQIDQANMSRIPGLNEFNRGQVSDNNAFNQSQREQAVNASGLDFRRRIDEQLGRLEERAATGRLPGSLDDALSKDLANRGSEIARSTGVGALSGAGVRANARMTVGERTNLALSADQQIPGVLQFGQSVLSAPEERAPTLFGEPQPIPMNATNVAERIPVTSSISAGAAQQGIASEINSYQLLPATGILTSGLQTDQYNESAQYARDVKVLDSQQMQQGAVDTATQGAINADVASGIREQQFGAFQAGNQVLRDSQAAQAYGNVAGGIQAGIAMQGLGAGTAVSQGSAGSSGSGFVDGVMTGVGNLATLAQQGIGGTIDAVAGGIDTVFGDGNGQLTIGNTQVSSEGFNNFLGGVREFFTGELNASASGVQELKDINGSPVIQAIPKDDGSVDFKAEDGSVQNVTRDTNFSDFLTSVTKPFEDSGVDLRAVGQTANAVTNWDRMSTAEQLNSASQIGTTVLENRGMITNEEAGDMRRIGGSLSILANPNSTTAQRIAAGTTAVASAGTTSFSGTPQQPQTIGGNQVLGSTMTPDGEQGFIVSQPDGTTSVVPQSDLTTASNIQSGIQVFSVLTSNASTEDKARALGSVGIQGAAANNLISQVAAGNTLAGLSIFNTAANWDRMNTFQRGISVMQTGSAVVGATNQMLAQQTANQTLTQAGSQVVAQTGSQVATQAGTQVAAQTGTQATSQAVAQGAASGSGAAASSGGAAATTGVGTYVAGVGIVAGAALGIKTAADTIDASGDLSSSQNVGKTSAGMAAAGAGIGAAVGVGAAMAAGASAGAAMGSSVPIVGTAIGAVVGALVGVAIGSTGSGKGTGQMMRDGWRDAMEKGGFAEKDPTTGHSQLSLADGSKFVLYDGKHQLDNKGANIDGKNTRFTTEVDWSNPTAVETIPEAHLFAIATGLDPTTNKGHGLFQKAVAQGSNAAISNASDPDAARENFKAILSKAEPDPRNIAMRIETLRVSNRITDAEYGVYLDRLNKTYGSQIMPTDRQKAVDGIVSRLKETPYEKMDSHSKDLYDNLTDPKKLMKSQERLEKRLAFEREDMAKYPSGAKKPTSEIKPMSKVPSQRQDTKPTAPRNAGRPVPRNQNRYSNPRFKNNETTLT